MALRYGLIENLLTSDPNDYMAVTTDNDTVGIDQIVERMISRGSTVTKAEALSVLEEFNQAVVDLAQMGVNINTELFTIYPSISGVFNSSSEVFSTGKHAINLKMRAGNRLRNIHKSIVLERVSISEAKPFFQVVTDLKTGAVNDILTIGQVVSIKGSMLRISEEVPNAGLFIIGEGTPEMRITQLVKNKPSELIFFVPEGILPGACTLELRTIIPGRKTLSTCRSSFELNAVV